MSPSPFVTPDRRAAPPPGTRLYAMGDIHGRCDLLTELLLAVLTDAGRAAAEHVLVVCLGDYIDRGAQSREVVDLLIAAPERWPGVEWVFLKGNHEDALLRFLDGERAGGANWMMNGGLNTVESYADQPVNAFDLDDLRQVMERAVPPAHRAFLDKLGLSRVCGDYCLVHAGLRPGLALKDQDPEDLLWIRGDFLSDPAPHGRIVVHGHTPVRGPDVRSNRIGIDTGAYVTGRLTALVAQGTEIGFLST